MHDHVDQGIARLLGAAERIVAPRQIRVQFLFLVAQAFLLQTRVHSGFQQRRIERLDQVVVRASLDAAHHTVEFIHSRNHDHRQMTQRRVLLHLFQDAEPIQFRHHNVQENEIRVLCSY